MSTPSSPTHILTPTDVHDLRTSVRRAVPLDTATIGQFANPSIIYLPTDDAFGLVVGSRLVAVSQSAPLLAQCLRCERAEPGFISRILNPAEDVRLASLDPHAARIDRLRAFTERERARTYSEAQALAISRRQAALNTNPAEIDLSDIGL